MLNYVSSHDDSAPFEAAHMKPYETANKLLPAPGAAQIHYGDETARLLNVDGAEGDANLRSFMNWNELATFKRMYDKGGVRDRVVVASGLTLDRDTAVSVRGVFGDGQTVRDDYTGQRAVVADGKVQFAARNAVVLIVQD